MLDVCSTYVMLPDYADAASAHRSFPVDEPVQVLDDVGR